MEIQTHNELSKSDIATNPKRKNSNGAKISLMFHASRQMITLNDAASYNKINNNKY